MKEKGLICYQLFGILNALCILISGIYGFIDIGYNRNNYLTNVIVNLICILFSFLFIYGELISSPDLEAYRNKSVLFLFFGLLILGTSEIGFILGFFVIFYSLINIVILYCEYKNRPLINIENSNNNQENNQNLDYTNDLPPNPYEIRSQNQYNAPNNSERNFDVNTINRHGNIVQYGSHA